MAKSKQIHIFATRSDLAPGLAKAEAELEIQYARCGRYSSSSELEQYSSLLEWEGLGKNTTDNHMTGHQFLVTPKSLKINLEPVAVSGTPAQQPGTFYFLNQKLNPDSIVFSPGGVYKDQPAIIAGHIGSVSQSSNAIALYKSFVKAVTQDFEKIGSYHVGQEAARLMAQGHRMVTIGLGSPAIYDLKRA